MSENDELGDPLVSKEHILAFEWLSEDDLNYINQISLRINDLLSGLLRAVGIKLVDLKIEYGKIWNEDKQKEIVLVMK